MKAHSAALASAVNGLHGDDGPGWSINADNDANPNPNPDPNFAAGMAEWGAKWGQIGAAIGERYAKAYGARPMPPAPQALPAQQLNFDFSGFSHGRKYGDREIDAMVGVTDDYRKEIADAGFAQCLPQ